MTVESTSESTNKIHICTFDRTEIKIQLSCPILKQKNEVTH